MRGSTVDLPSLLMVLCFTVNLMICFIDRGVLLIPEPAGMLILILGSAYFVYVLVYLRSGFFGDTKPVLGHLVTNGPYRFCRHPLYLSFIIMVLGFDLVFRSAAGILFTFTVSVLSVVYRGKAEDRLLREKFGSEWDEYAEEVGFLLPRLRRPSKTGV